MGEYSEAYAVLVWTELWEDLARINMFCEISGANDRIVAFNYSTLAIMYCSTIKVFLDS